LFLLYQKYFRKTIFFLSRRWDYIHKTKAVKAKMNALCVALTDFILWMMGNQA